MYNLVTESNYKDVINKMTEKGYPMINEELSTKFPKGNGDIFLYLKKSIVLLINKRRLLLLSLLFIFLLFIN